MNFRGEHMRFDTLLVRGGYKPEESTKAMAVPIYQTTAYAFDDVSHAAKLFSLEEAGNIYTRIMNPTTDVFEKRMAALEGGVGAVAFASGMAAIVAAVQNIVSVGDEIVAAGTLYGGTYNIFNYTLPRLGITTKFINPDDPENFKKAITDKTKLVYIETIGNPGINIIDIEAVANIAHEAGIPLMVDNTFATPYLCRPIEFGADIVVHSATKYIGGNGSAMGGIVVDSGKFDWSTSGKFPCLTEPDESYHGIVYTRDCGEAAYITKLRVQILRDTGACLSPFNAFLLLNGLETLSLRVQRHTDNAMKIAQFLKNHPNVAWVNYPSLPDNPYYELAKRYLPKGVGAIFTFGVKGGKEKGAKVSDALKLFFNVANVADSRSLIIHPASTTHAQLSEADQKIAGVMPDMLRLSIGIEDVADLIEDLDQALKAD